WSAHNLASAGELIGEIRRNDEAAIGVRVALLAALYDRDLDLQLFGAAGRDHAAHLQRRLLLGIGLPQDQGVIRGVVLATFQAAGYLLHGNFLLSALSVDNDLQVTYNRHTVNKRQRD